MSLKLIKYYLAENKKNIAELIESINVLAEQKRQEIAQNLAELEEMRASGKYSQSYLDSYLSTLTDKKNYKEMLNRTVTMKRARIERNNEKIKECIEEYYNSPLNNDLSNKLIAYKQMDVDLTTKELANLEKSAKSYADKKLFDKFASDRGYASRKMPNFDVIEHALNDYLGSTTNALNYGGKGAELIEYIDAWTKFDSGAPRAITPSDKGLCSAGDAFITKDATGAFSAFLDNTGIDLDFKPLNEDELQIVEDAIQGDKYPYLIESSVKEHAENSVMHDLLLRHDEYREYLL